MDLQPSEFARMAQVCGALLGFFGGGENTTAIFLVAFMFTWPKVLVRTAYSAALSRQPSKTWFATESRLLVLNF